MSLTLNAFTQSPVGRIVYRPFKIVLRISRRLINPGLPEGHKITRVSYRQRKFAIEHRRWGDQVIVDECFREAQYDLPKGPQGHLAEQLYREVVDSGKKPLIVDCGANIGVSVLWLTARYPEAHIVAIEPAPDNFDFLCRNCSGLDVDLRNVGIGAHDGTAKPQSSYTPFLLKVDIEGAERFLFSSGHALLNQFPVILMEPHDRFYPGQGTSLEFFRFHADYRRDFAMNNTTIASVALHPAHAIDAEAEVR